MNKYLVTLNFGRDLLVPNSRQSMRHAAARWGATFVEITRSSAPGFAAQVRLDHLAPRPGRVAYYDRDMVIRDDCPSVFELVPEGHFGFVLADQGHLSEEFRRQWNVGPFNHWARALGSTIEYTKEAYFNGGFMVFDLPAHARVFARARVALGEQNHNISWYDVQGCLSASANLGDVPTQRLPATFNLISHQQPRPLRPEYMSAYVYHFDGLCPREKVAFAVQSVWKKEGWRLDSTAGEDDRVQRFGGRLRRQIRRATAATD